MTSRLRGFAQTELSIWHLQPYVRAFIRFVVKLRAFLRHLKCPPFSLLLNLFANCALYNFQVIIPASWIFSLIFNLPFFLVVEVKGGYCKNVWVNGQDWMPKAYQLLWSSMVAVAVAMMAGLYSRIVYILWLKRAEENPPAFQQRVSTSNKRKFLYVQKSFTLPSSRYLFRGCSQIKPNYRYNYFPSHARHFFFMWLSLIFPDAMTNA